MVRILALLAGLFASSAAYAQAEFSTIISPTTFVVTPTGVVGVNCLTGCASSGASPQSVVVTTPLTMVIASPTTYVVTPTGTVGVNCVSGCTGGVSPQSVVVINAAQGSIGTTADSLSLSPFSSGTLISVVKGILANVLTPISVAQSQSPQNVTMASPVSVSISTVSSPVNVTGSFSATLAASNYSWNVGTGNSGNIYSKLVTLMTTELTSLSSGSVTTSVLSFNNSVGDTGTSGAIWGEVAYQSTGPATVACTAGANIAGWFALTINGQTEGATSGTQALGRPPDFIVPTVTPFNIIQKAAGLVRLPSVPFKVVAQNNCGATLNSAGNNLYLIPMAVYH